MTSPSRRGGGSAANPTSEDEDFACQSDVRFADTTETPDSTKLAATAENYQLESEAPIVQDVTEDEKQFVGDLTEIGSPATDSENVSSTVVTGSSAIATVDTAARRNVASSTVSSISPPRQQQLRQYTNATTTSATTSTSSSTLASSTTSSTSQLLAVGEAIPLPTSKRPTPDASHAAAEWTEEVEGGAGESRQALSSTSPTKARLLHRVSSSEWPADLNDNPEGADNEGARVMAASNSEAAPAVPAEDEFPMRTRFEATFDHPDRLSNRVLQRFDVTYEKRPSQGAISPGSAKTAKFSKASPRSRSPAPRPRSPYSPKMLKTTLTSWQKVPKTIKKISLNKEDDSQEDELLTDEDAQKQPAEEPAVPEEASVLESSGSSEEDGDDYFDDEPMFRTGRSARQHTRFDRPQPEGAAAKEDAALFNRLLEILDVIMAGADDKLSRPNVRTANRLISKEVNKDGKSEIDKYNPSTTFNDMCTSDDHGSDGHMVAAAAAALAEDVAIRLPIGKKRVGVDDGTSSEVSSQDDTLSTSKDDPRNTEKASGDREAQAAPSNAPSITNEMYHSGSLNQVYSSYLAKDSGEKVKRQIGTHYLRQYYGPTEHKSEKDDLEIRELKRRSQVKSRLSRGLGYCSYLLPLIFVIVVFGYLFFFSAKILLKKKVNTSYTLIMYVVTATAGGVFYCYNIFASERNAI